MLACHLAWGCTLGKNEQALQASEEKGGENATSKVFRRCSYIIFGNSGAVCFEPL
jgi:hypothetical protein